MPSRRTLVWLAGALAALLVVAVLAVMAARREPAPTGALPAQPAVVGTVRVGAEYNPGATVFARISLQADRPMSLRDVVVEVRNVDRLTVPTDPAQRPLDLTEGRTSFGIGAKTTTTTLSQTIFTAGTYRYNLGYRWKGRQYSLPPYGTFVVR